MNRHRHIQHLLSDYIDGCLPAGAIQRVDAHLAECPACARELDQWRAVLQLVSRHASVPCPIDCAQAVVERLRADWSRAEPGGAEPLPPSLAGRGSRPVTLWFSVATALVMLLGGWGWVLSSRAHHETSHGTVARLGSPSPLLPVTPAVHVDAPDRLDGAFGHSDSLILASDFADDDR